MISLFILYSADRRLQLERTLGCLADLEGVSDCQKILCVDGSSDISPEGFEVVEVPRLSGKYCWADAWAAAMARTVHPIVWYLDADRAFPRDFLQLILKHSQPGNLVYAARSYRLLRDLDLDGLRAIRDEISSRDNEPSPNCRDIEIEEISIEPGIDYRKNPCSGSFAIWKDSYLALGGFDRSYQGWGFPDTDFFMLVRSRNFEVRPLDTFQLHQFHGYSASELDFLLDNTWNGIVFARKWNVGRNSIERQLAKLKIDPAAAFECQSFGEFEALCDKARVSRSLEMKSHLKRILPRRLQAMIFERYRRGPARLK